MKLKNFIVPLFQIMKQTLKLKKKKYVQKIAKIVTTKIYV